MPSPGPAQRPSTIGRTTIGHTTIDRRRFLGAGLAAGTVLAAGGWTAPARAQEVGSSVTRGLAAVDLEVPTATDTAITLSWSTVAPGPSGGLVPAPADTEVLLGPADGTAPLRQVHHDATPTAIHHVTVEGLEPGRPYRFEARSNGVRAVGTHVITALPGSPEATGVVTTLVPPPGRLLHTVAVANDIHIGEEVHGLIAGDFPPGVAQEAGLPPFPEVMLAGLVEELRAAGIRQLFANGDLTAEARPAEVRRARELLDGFGTRGVDWWATRGNHDRPHTGEEVAACEPSVAGHRDCFGELFTPWQRPWEARVGGLRVLGMDSVHLDAAGGWISPEQIAEVERMLVAEPDRPTLSLCHHPVTRDARWSNAGGPSFTLDEADALRLQGLHARTPGVFLHMGGHTHRTRRGAADVAPTDGRAPAEYLEAGNVSGYPGNYTRLRLYEGGYMVTLHRIASPLALRWATRSRSAHLGLGPEYLFGTFADRNHVVHRDLSGI